MSFTGVKPMYLPLGMNVPKWRQVKRAKSSHPSIFCLHIQLPIPVHHHTTNGRRQYKLKIKINQTDDDLGTVNTCGA